MATVPSKRLLDKEEIKKAAEDNLLTFIKLVAPNRMLGAVHEDLVSWWTRDEALDNQLVLLPRDHQKSAMVAYRVAWWITKHPDTTILYVSATADLAEKQLKFIKDIITSDRYTFYWPEMVNPEENKRERWSMEEIAVDHPRRKKEGVRDPTIKAVGLTANTTGLHCNVAVLDDVVVPSNAYTEVGRDQVKAFYSQLSSIETTQAKEWVVGTRYHPDDLYKELVDMREVFYVEETEEDVDQEVYELFERQVETDGEFLWPKQRRKDGKVFGFDERELARKKAKYLDITQFYAQYYNNPNSVETATIDNSKFQYYERSNLQNLSGAWYLNGELLSVFAAIDFAYTISQKSDYTAIVVVGVDSRNNRFILDIDRFKTNKISVMYEKLLAQYRKWNFRKMRAEITAAQSMIVSQFKDYMRQQNVLFSIDEHRPQKNKEERIAATLEPLYANNIIWHYKGGNCQTLEGELLLAHPEHDDIKDCLAAVMDICAAPMKRLTQGPNAGLVFNSKFGGVSYK